MAPLGRMLIFLGLAIAAFGVLLNFSGRLPGDIVIRGRNTTFYFPLVTCLILSALVSLLLWIFRR